MGQDYEEFQFRKGIEATMQCLYLVSRSLEIEHNYCLRLVLQTSQFFQQWAPWQLVKDPEQHSTVETVLLVVMESLRLSACHLHPILPTHCSTLLQRLGFQATPTQDDLQCKLTEDGVKELERASVNFMLNQNKTPLFAKFRSVSGPPPPKLQQNIR